MSAATTKRQSFPQEPVRVLLRDAATDGRTLREVRFVADLNARWDRGMPAYGIDGKWVAPVKVEGRTEYVSRYERDGAVEWFYCEVPHTDDDDDAEEGDY